MKSNQIKVAIIGYGYWGPNVLRAFSEVASAQIVVCCDLKTKNLQLVKQRYPSIKTTTDVDDILKDESINAVIITTPLSTHYPIALKALKAKKHVWIEKPMTQNSEQAKKLIKLAQKNNLLIFVDHIFLYTQAVSYLKKFIQSGNLGDIYYFDSRRINLGIVQQDNNVIWDLATHDISIMCHLLDKLPKEVSAYGTTHIKKGFEDIAYLNFSFDDNNISSHVAVSWLSPVKMRRTILAGSKKMVTYDDLETSEKIKIYDYGISPKKSYRPDSPTTGHQYRTGSIHSPALEGKEALQNAANHFIECIKFNKQPLSNGQAGYQLVKILEAASKSLNHKGKKERISI